MMASKRHTDLLRNLETGVERQNPGYIAGVSENFLGTPVLHDINAGIVQQYYDPISIFRTLTALDKMKQDWPNMVGRNLESVEFAPPSTFKSGGRTLGRAGAAMFQQDRDPFRVLFTPELLGKRGLKSGSAPADLSKAHWTPVHEMGHGIWNQIMRIARGDNPLLHLADDPAIDAMNASQRLVSQLNERLPFGENLRHILKAKGGEDTRRFFQAMELEPDLQHISPYAARGYNDSYNRLLETVSGAPLDMPRSRQVELTAAALDPYTPYRFHEPFAESIASRFMTESPVLQGNPRIEAAKRALGQSSFYQAVDDILPEIQRTAGFSKVGMLAGLAGLGALPLIEDKLPDKSADALRAMALGASIGGIPGGALGLASQIVPDLLF